MKHLKNIIIFTFIWAIFLVGFGWLSHLAWMLFKMGWGWVVE